MVVYPTSVTGIVMDSPLCMLITLDRNDAFSIFYINFVCMLVQSYNKNLIPQHFDAKMQTKIVKKRDPGQLAQEPRSPNLYTMEEGR